MTTTEQRYAERLLIRRPMSLTSLSTEGSESTASNYKVIMIDLSMKGMGVLMNAPLEINTPLQAHLSLPNFETESKIEPKVKVAYCNKIQNQYLIGLEITDLKTQEQLVLKDFFNYHSRFK